MWHQVGQRYSHLLCYNISLPTQLQYIYAKYEYSVETINWQSNILLFKNLAGAVGFYCKCFAIPSIALSSNFLVLIYSFPIHIILLFVLNLSFAA